MTVERRGAVAVIVRQERLLLIRRSATVVAPGTYAFPGGGIEPDETDEQAVVRELQEELGVDITPVRELWRGRTRSGAELIFWLADLDAGAELAPNPAEVASLHWLTLDEISVRADLLPSMHEFLAAFRAGYFHLD